MSLPPSTDVEEAPAPESELALLQRAQSGDEDAFGVLVRAHYEPVFRLVQAVVHNEHDARDICQEVWVAVWNNLKKFRGDAKFSTWVHPIAVRRAVDHLRRRRRWFDRFLPFADKMPEVEATPETTEQENPQSELEHAERIAQFKAAIDALPPKLRTALALREVQGLSYEEIAKLLNCRPGTVMSRIFNARRLLVRNLGQPPESP